MVPQTAPRAASLDRLSGLVLCLAVVATLACAFHLVTGIGGPRVDAAFTDAGFTVALGLAAVALVLRTLVVRTDRTAWMLIAVGVVSWAAGDVVWATTLADLDEPPYPSWADALYLASYPCWYAGIGLLVRARLRGVGSSLWLDGLITAVGAASLAALLVGPIMESTGGRTEIVVTNLAYPVGDLVLLTVTIVAIGLTGWRLQAMWSRLGAGLVVTALADTIYLFSSSRGTYAEGGPLDLLWPIAGLLLAWAAWAPAAERRPVRTEGWRLLVVPTAAVAVAVALLFADHGPTVVNTTARALALMTLLLAAARIVLAFRESVADARRQRRLALTDELTGLGNRRLLLRDLETAVEEATPADPRLLMMFDLNGFKQYNDAFGHPAGDGLLARLAGRLQLAVDSHGAAYRMGGDEFCVLLRPGPVPAEDLLAAATAALSEDGSGFTISAASGAVLLPEEATTATDALQLADHRLYHEKDGRPSSAQRQLRSVLLQAIQERTPSLHDHGVGVAELADAIGRSFGMDAEELDILVRGAELHDVGKIAVPDAILEKPGPLDEEEMAFMRTHTVLGERILLAAPALAPVAAVVRASHERWDGRGYPDGLAGADIPLGARIIFVCDAYEAITSDRAYRAGASHEHALAELRAGAGTQFDPDVVTAFCAAISAQRAAVRSLPGQVTDLPRDRAAAAPQAQAG